MRKEEGQTEMEVPVITGSKASGYRPRTVIVIVPVSSDNWEYDRIETCAIFLCTSGYQTWCRSMVHLQR